MLQIKKTQISGFYYLQFFWFEHAKKQNVNDINDINKKKIVHIA